LSNNKVKTVHIQDTHSVLEQILVPDHQLNWATQIQQHFLSCPWLPS